MPSLKAFGRRWNIASDDFVFPGFTEAFVRSIWVLTCCIVFALHNPLQCETLSWLYWILGLLVINALSIAFACGIAWHSSKGSIMETSARRMVVTLIYCRVPLFLIEISWTVIMTVLLLTNFGEEEFCDFVYGILFTVVLEWVIVVTVGFGLVMVFNPHGEHSMNSFMVEKSYFRTILGICKIGRDTQMRNAIDDIATLMESFFIGEDVVWSDIAAGLLLVVHSPLKSETNLISSSLDPIRTPAWMELPKNFETVCRYMNFASAVYGWPAYMFNNCSVRSWSRLFRTIKFCRGCDSKQVIVVEDNCFSCNTAAFLLDAGISDTDLYYVSFRNRLYQTPFVVCTDHVTQSNVIAIRGSASLMDMLTDLSLNCDRFSINVDCDPILREDSQLDYGETRVHRGMLNAARFVYNTMKNNHVLEDLAILNPGYRLVICGHSLGAGIASLLTLLLKQEYPDIRCYSFSPPGCVVSMHGLQEMENHVLSVTVGDDIVPRVNYQALQRLKTKVRHEINTTRKAKFEILIKGLYKLFFTSSFTLHDSELAIAENYSRLISENSGDSERSTYGTVDNGDIEAAIECDVVESQDGPFHVQLYPPGKLAHISVSGQNLLQLQWVNPEFYSDINLTGSAITDHFPNRVRKTLQQFVTQMSTIYPTENI